MWSFIKICLICIIGINRLKEKFHRKTRNTYSTTPCHVATVKIWAHFDSYWRSNEQLNLHPLFSIFSLATIVVGNRDHWTQFWKGDIQGPFQQSLVSIGSVVSEEKNKMWKANDRWRTTDETWWQKLTWHLARWVKKDIRRKKGNGCMPERRHCVSIG